MKMGLCVHLVGCVGCGFLGHVQNCTAERKNPSATRKTAEIGEGRALEMSVIDRESVNRGSQTHAPK